MQQCSILPKTTPWTFTIYNFSRTTPMSTIICNAKGQFQWTSTIFNCSRTTLMSSTTTIMLKTILWTYINFAKDNSFGVREIGTIDNDMLLST